MHTNLRPREFQRVYETLPGNGWLTEEEAQLLWVSAVGKCKVLEVGCHHGRSTVLLAKAAGFVYAVDPFAGFDSDDPTGEIAYNAFRKNLEERGINNVHLIQCRIEEWKLRKVDMAYLDGDHTPEGTAAQINIAKLCNASTIAIHDVNDSGDGRLIKECALEMLGFWDQRVGRLAVWDFKGG